MKQALENQAREVGEENGLTGEKRFHPILFVSSPPTPMTSLTLGLEELEMKWYKLMRSRILDRVEIMAVQGCK